MKKAIVILRITVLFLGTCVNINGQEKNMEIDTTDNVIWQVTRGYAPFSENNGIHGEITYLYLWVNENYVKNLPVEIKQQIAFYSTFIPKDLFYYEKSDTILAKVLGDFSTLEDAQEVLLKNTVIDYIMPIDDFPAILKIKTIDGITYFEGTLNNSGIKISDKYIKVKGLNTIGNNEE